MKPHAARSAAHGRRHSVLGSMDAMLFAAISVLFTAAAVAAIAEDFVAGGGTRQLTSIHEATASPVLPQHVAAADPALARPAK